MAEEYISKSRLITSIENHAAEVGINKELYQLAHEHIIDVANIQPALDVGKLVAKVCMGVKCDTCPFNRCGCEFMDINGNIPCYEEWDAASGIAKYRTFEAVFNEGADNGNKQ